MTAAPTPSRPDAAGTEHASRSALAQRIGEECRLKGEFTLRSGKTSTTYFDKFLFQADPDLLRSIAFHLAHLVPQGTEVLAGLELGGVPISTALASATGLPVCFVRKQAKSYGTKKLAEGAGVAGRQVLVLEDVITTGGQVVESATQLRALGARVDAVLCVIDRSEGDHTKLSSAGLDVVALFSSNDIG
jgi:orotate phosphoribosyltransferase